MGQPQLQSLLESVLGSRNVYFQPPPNIQMAYPAIVYKLDYAVTQFADDYPYTFSKRYQVTAIDRNPDSQLLDKLARLQKSTFNRSFQADGLNHFVFNIYF